MLSFFFTYTVFSRSRFIQSQGRKKKTTFVVLMICKLSFDAEIQVLLELAQFCRLRDDLMRSGAGGGGGGTVRLRYVQWLCITSEVKGEGSIATNESDYSQHTHWSSYITVVSICFMSLMFLQV